MITPDQIPDPARPLDERECATVTTCERVIDARITTAGHRDQWPAIVTLEDPGRRVRDHVLGMYRLAGWSAEERGAPVGAGWVVVVRLIEGQS